MKKLIVIFLIAFPFVMSAQMTYIPDDNFELTLVGRGYDLFPLNDSIPTKNIDTIRKLNINGRFIGNLTGIEDFLALEELNCSFNQIKKLDMVKKSALIKLICSSNELTSLNLSNNIALEILECHNNDLTSLDLSNNAALVRVKCYSNQLTSLDIGVNPVLKYLDCSSNQLISFDLSNDPALESLICADNRLTSLDLRRAVALEYLDARNNSDLSCIKVTDPSYADDNDNWNKDSTAIYSSDCGELYVLNDNIKSDNISIFPNPASDFLEISIQGERIGSPLHGIKIYNSLGECVIYLTPALSEGEGARIDVSGLAAGVYFVTFSGQTCKFIKY